LDQTGDISRLSESAVLLTALAGNLHDAVGRFRVDDASTASDDNPIQLRKSPRFRVAFPVSYVVDGSSVVKRGQSRDLGGGGIYFESGENLSANTSMTISFELRPGVKVELRGRQITASDHDPANTVYGHRVAFFEIPDVVRESILSYILEKRREALMAHGELACA
jgi:c-di-GMP-binding flagellar brake protein YcgR